MDDEEALLQELLETEPTRRRALERIILGAMAALGIGSAIPILGYLSSERQAGEAGGARLLVGTLDELPPGTALKVALEAELVLILNAEGEVRAFSAICPHLGCIVVWQDEGQFIQCPCHDGRFDTSGQVISGPPPAPLPEIPVAVEEGRIYLGSA